MAFTVTASEGGSLSNGITLAVKVITGAAASQPGAVAGIASVTPALAITPNGTGSWVYGANLGLAGTYTPNAATTYEQNVAPGDGLEHIALRSTATTTAGTPVTLGGSATANSISVALAEILAAGVLAEDASSPAPVSTSVATSIATGSFTPPAAFILVAMVSSNGGVGVCTMSLTDTSGLGLIWTERQKQNAAGGGYSGVWTAQLPSSLVIGDDDVPWHLRSGI